MKQRPSQVIHAAAIRDATGLTARPGAVLVQDGRVVAAGPPDSLPHELVGDAETIDRRGDLLLPAMVNAHAHLELTGLKPLPYDPAAGFMGWVRALRSELAKHDQPDSRIAIRSTDPPGPSHLQNWLVSSAEQGAQRSMRAAVQAVGDICTLDTTEAIASNQGIDAIGYREFFGLDSAPDPRSFAPESCPKHRGLQPHSPYSAGPRLYAAACQASIEIGWQLSTHLAETQDELRFIARGDGPMLDYLKSIGKWADSYADFYGVGLSPVQWMRPHLERIAGVGGWLVAHCNYISDEDIAILADTNTSVAYCPIASEYFGHTGHRYREMLDAGVNVCLGTDSIICANPQDSQPLGLLSAVRRLYERDRTDPAVLLAMATTHGAKALWLDQNAATLWQGASARFACIAVDTEDERDPLEQVLTSQAEAQPLWLT